MHDRSRVEVFCYNLWPNLVVSNSGFTQRIERGSDHFEDLSVYKEHTSAAEHIHNDRIHILVNLNGYTGGLHNCVQSLSSE